MDFSQTCVSTSPMYALPVILFEPEVNTRMYLRKASALQADSFHNLDPRQMICISFYVMHHSVLKVKKNLRA